VNLAWVHAVRLILYKIELPATRSVKKCRPLISIEEEHGSVLTLGVAECHLTIQQRNLHTITVGAARTLIQIALDRSVIALLNNCLEKRRTW
jgi:hypothetical protein